MEKFDIFEHKYAYITLFIIFVFFMSTWHALDKIQTKNNINENINEENVIREDDSENMDDERYNSKDEDDNYQTDENRYNHTEESHEDNEDRYRDYSPHKDNDYPERDFEQRHSSDYIPQNVDTDEYIRSTESRRIGE